MGKSRKGVQQVSTKNNSLRQQLIDDLVGVLISEETIDQFINICNNYGVTILDSIPGPDIWGFEQAQGIAGEVTVQLRDGQTVTIDLRFISQAIEESEPSNLETVFDTLNKVPSLFKQNFKTSHFKASSASCAYEGSGHIKLSGDFLSYSDNHDLNIRGAIIHEIFHSFDLGTDNIETFDDLKRVCSNGLSIGKGFQNILKHEPSSFYSNAYRPDGTQFGDRQSKQSVKWGTESFAEAMKVTAKQKLFGSKYAFIKVPVYDNEGEIVAERTVNYTEWKKISPNMAKLSEKVYSAKSREEAKQIMENYKYDYSLKPEPLTTDDYKERSIYVPD